VIVAEWVLPSLVGAEYGGVYRLMWVLAIAVVFLFLAQVLYAYLVALRMEGFLAHSSSFGSIVLLIGLGLAASTSSLALLFVVLLMWYITIVLVWGWTVWTRLSARDMHSGGTPVATTERRGGHGDGQVVALTRSS
jgi:O-antigen/teichoic acid export membrane protein